VGRPRTLGSWWDQLTDEERKERIALSNEKHQRLHDETAPHAIRHRYYWSPDDDEVVLLDEPLKLIARYLGRTYHAVAARRAILKRLAAKGQAPEYERDRDVDMGSVNTATLSVIPPCACATMDGDHADWCAAGAAT
jgi:hypothetical protein